MLIGECIATETPFFYTPWYERQGDAGTFMIEVIAFMANAHASAWVQNKNKEDADSAATIATGGTFSDIAAVGVHMQRATSLKELVRLRMEVKDSLDGDSWMHLRIVNTAWETN